MTLSSWLLAERELEAGGQAHKRLTAVPSAPCGLNAAFAKSGQTHLVSRIVAPVVAATLLLVGGCVDDSGTNPVPGSDPDSSRQTFTVGPAGGEVQYRSTENDVTLTLTFPAGALAEATEITIQHSRDYPEAAGLMAGAVFEFGPDGLVFLAPVELDVSYSAAMIGALPADNLRIHKVMGLNWLPLLGAVDTANHAVSATLTGFSVYGLKTIPPPNGGGDGTGGADTGDGGGASDPSTIVPTWYGVQTNILERFCTMCHSGGSPPRGLSWGADQYDTVVTNGRMSTWEPAMRIVDPGSPDTSYMFWKISGQGPNNETIQGVRMPATGVALEQAYIDVIERWILDGAPLGDPADADAGGGGGSDEPDYPVGSWMYVWSESLQVCTMCHTASDEPPSERCGVDFACPPKGVVLTADNYVGVVDGSIVRPFRPDNSKLWERVTENDPDKRMPFGLAPLTQPQLDIIRDWILDGAPFCPSGEVCP
ncbi:MAG: hypothetical protein OET44_16150 [Gammaproteobacteria bacterium]|nr:hypothetical protein [Gammaproteobacteria bacterium]